MAKARSRVSGVDRVFQVLDCLMERGAPATAYDVAKDIGAPMSTVYEVIAALTEKGVLRRVGSRGEVGLGPKLHFYGLAYLRDLNINAVFQRTMEELSRGTSETVQICGRDDDKMVVLMMEEGPGHFQVNSRVGSRIPLTWTASGRLLLATLPPTERKRILARAQQSPTGQAETDAARLETLCQRAWRDGLSVQITESEYAVACIAAPIRGADGTCTATVSLVVPESRARKQARAYADQVKKAAREIEEAMGWTRSPLGIAAAE